MLTGVFSIATYSPFTYAASCSQNCANTRTADLYACDERQTEKYRKKCISSAHKWYATCVKRCN